MIKSQPKISSKFVVYVAPISVALLGSIYGSYAITFIPKARLLYATLEPIFPKPITPKVLP